MAEQSENSVSGSRRTLCLGAPRRKEEPSEHQMRKNYPYKGLIFNIFSLAEFIWLILECNRLFFSSVKLEVGLPQCIGPRKGFKNITYMRMFIKLFGRVTIEVDSTGIL